MMLIPVVEFVNVFFFIEHIRLPCVSVMVVDNPPIVLNIAIVRTQIFVIVHNQSCERYLYALRMSFDIKERRAVRKSAYSIFSKPSGMAF